MNKKLLILLALAIVVIPVVSACAAAPTTDKSPLAPAIPHPMDVRFADCVVCHAQDEMYVLIPHAAYTNKDCMLPGCHAVASTATTTPPPSTTTSSSSTTSISTSSTATVTSTTSTAPKTLGDVAVPITSHSLSVLASYQTVGCLFCHGPAGGNPQPYAPSWNATTSASIHETGVYTITAGSKADHTGYTNATNCEQAGCHAAPTS